MTTVQSYTSVEHILLQSAADYDASLIRLPVIPWPLLAAA